MNTHPEQQPMSLREEFDKIWRRKYLIVGFTALISILAIVITMRSIMPPDYVSVAAFIPPGTRNLMTQNYNPKSYRGIGSAVDEDLDRFAGILNSDTVRHYMAQKFDLYGVYGIETDDPHRADKDFKKAYEDMVNVKVSKWSIVEIMVYDKDPYRAQIIAKEHLVYADSVAEEISGRKANLRELKQQIRKSEQLIDSLTQYAAKLREEYGIYNMKDLSDAAVRGMGNKLYTKGFHNNYDRLVYTENQLENLADEYEALVAQQNVLETKIAANPSLISVVKHPVVNMGPVRPKRMMIVILAFVGALLLSCFAVLLFDKPKAA